MEWTKTSSSSTFLLHWYPNHAQLRSIETNSSFEYRIVSNISSDSPLVEQANVFAVCLEGITWKMKNIETGENDTPCKYFCRRTVRLQNVWNLSVPSSMINCPFHATISIAAEYIRHNSRLADVRITTSYSLDISSNSRARVFSFLFLYVYYFPFIHK